MVIKSDLNGVLALARLYSLWQLYSFTLNQQINSIRTLFLTADVHSPSPKGAPGLLNLWKKSGDSDRWRVAMKKEPVLGRMGARQEQRGTCNQNDVRKGESTTRKRQTCMDSNAHPSAHHWDPIRTSSHSEDAPATLSLAHQDKASSKTGLQQPSSAKAASHGSSPLWSISTCAPNMPREQGLQPHINITSEVRSGAFSPKPCWHGNLFSKTTAPEEIFLNQFFLQSSKANQYTNLPLRQQPHTFSLLAKVQPGWTSAKEIK